MSCPVASREKNHKKVVIIKLRQKPESGKVSIKSIFFNAEIRKQEKSLKLNNYYWQKSDSVKNCGLKSTACSS